MSIRGFIMGLLNRWGKTDIETVTRVKTCVGEGMAAAIRLWGDIASGNASWNEKAPSCGVVQQVVGRLSSLVAREIAIKTDNDAIASVIDRLDKDVDTIVSYMVMFGGCLLRPIYADGGLQYELLPLGNYYPIRYALDGTLTAALITKHLRDGDGKWLLTEKHEWAGGVHRVKCALYRDRGGALREVTMADCPLTVNVTSEYEWHDVQFPMIAEFRLHKANMIDGSQVPVSLFAGAEGLLKDCDEQYARMVWEQEAGTKIVWADADLFGRRVTRHGDSKEVKLTPTLHKLLVRIDGDGSEGKKIVEYSPALRTDAQALMMQEILRRLELTLNIGKGTISSLDSAPQTATQYSGGRQELYALVDQIEDDVEAKMRMAARIYAHIASAYALGGGTDEVAITWNDEQTRKDIGTAKQLALQEVSSGVLNAWEYRMMFMNEDAQTAKANVPSAETADNTAIW